MAAAVLSNRYITERFLPDKAIDLVDEAASRLRMEMDSMPAELDELERRRMQLEIEREALRKEKDDASKARLEALEKELADLRERGDVLKASGSSEKEVVAEHPRRRATELERLQPEIEAAERAADYAPRRRAALRQDGRAPEAAGGQRGAAAGAARQRVAAAQGGGRRRRHRATSWRAGPASPYSRLMEGELEKLLKMEERLHERSSARTRRSPPSPTPSGGPGPA